MTSDTSSAHSHTLTSRPYFFPSEVTTRSKQLESETLRLLAKLPAELRWKVFGFAFAGNRVAVTSEAGCYCASSSTGPYRGDHRWLLMLQQRRSLASADRGSSNNGDDDDDNDQRARVRGVLSEARRAFVRTAMWEVHCARAMHTFVARMAKLRYLDQVRHVRVNVFEDVPDGGVDGDDVRSIFPNLRSVTFAPSQKGWTIVVPERPRSDALSDANILLQIWNVLESIPAYATLRRMCRRPRSGDWGETTTTTTRTRYAIHFVFPIQFHLPRSAQGRDDPGNESESESSQPRWQLCVWRANLDACTIERDWREVHLVQEATLD